jgi:mannosyltransferase OCH1-like enzyme
MEITITEKDESEEKREQEEQQKPGIPKRIFQTHKSIQYIQSKPKLQIAMKTWRQFVPEFGYHFYTNEMCDEFMRTNMVEEFGDVIYEVYNRLPLPVMKADLWRYCIIYKYGGIYADADAMCTCNPNIFTNCETMMVCAPEEDTMHLCQWTFAAPEKSPLLKSIIELSIKRIANMQVIKGEHIIHFLTGPGVFTDGIEKYLQENDMKTFNNKKQYSCYKNSVMICFIAERFHQTMIRHLHAGADADGWKNERFQKLM